jgi:hypothetical protein
MVVVDEVARRNRASSLDFLDFLEAFCRVADLVRSDKVHSRVHSACMECAWPPCVAEGQSRASPSHWLVACTPMRHLTACQC